MDSDLASSEEAAPPGEAPRHLARRIALWSGGMGLLLVTLYLIVMAILWHAQVDDLVDAKHDLSVELAEGEASLQEATLDLESARSNLDETLAGISELANDKAQAADYRFLMMDGATAMASCATEAGELLGEAYQYYPANSWTWERAVRDYCAEISLALEELAAEAEVAIS